MGCLCISRQRLWAAALLGAFRFDKLRSRIADFHDNFSLIQGATLTLLGLLIAFAFSMAVGRVGVGSTNAKGSPAVLVALPLVVSVAFFLIADIDSPRGGVIPVSPQNLLALARSRRGQ